ncbi:MAG TPA: hypothetical protein PKK10_06455 [Woeseiaceae bacterium]|nr:hypothetical protein [Woeseiaceae bacterium]
MSFLLSIVALLAGPFIYGWGRQRPVAKEMLNGFILVAVAGIVCVNIIPGALDAGGLWAVVALAAGLLFPVLFEKSFAHSMHRAHTFVVVLAAFALIVHALIDGIALLPEANASLNAAGARTYPGDLGSTLTDPLALGVILHRLPVGMAIWWSVRPNFGPLAALFTFGLIIAATGAAYVYGAPVVELAEARSLALFQAFVAGSLVHVVAFGVSHDHEHNDEVFVPVDNWGFRVGLLLGMFIIFAVPHIH